MAQTMTQDPTTTPAGSTLATRPQQTPAVITSPDQYQDAMKRWAGRYNVLTPFTNLSGLAPQHGIVVSVVQINPDPAKGGPGEVYDGLPFLGRGEVALAKIGLRKIADCGGITTETIRTDPRTIPHYWEVKAIATYTGIDGRTIRREATVEWDLRDGSPRLKGWKPDQVSEGRKNGLRNCEARAINAAIRECGVKQKYSKEELQKPFLVVRVAFQPDLSDPEQRRLVTEHALRGTSALYPRADHSMVIEAETVDASSPMTAGEPAATTTQTPAETTPATTTAAASETATTTAKADEPPTEYAVRIVSVDEVTGTTNGKPWTRVDVTTSTGEVLTTFSQSLRDRAVQAQQAQEWVELSTETRGKYTNLIEIVRAGSAPTLPGMGAL